MTKGDPLLAPKTFYQG